MPEIPRVIINAVQRVLSSIRLSLDSETSRYRPAEVPVGLLHETYLRFESVRFRFRSRAGSRLDASSIDPFVELQHDIRVLLSDQQFSSVLERVRYRPTMPRRDLESVGFLHPALVEGSIDAAAALFYLSESLDRLPLKSEPNVPSPSPAAAARKIKQIVPKEQHVAPVQFDVVNGRLTLITQKGKIPPEDQPNVSAARNELTSRGEEIIQQLERSNCDKRLLETFVELQSKLTSDVDVVRLGLSNIACEVMCSQFDSELPSAVSAMIKSHTLGVNMYVAQFPEWQRFTEQAANVDLTADAIPALTAAVNAVVEKLAGHEELSDPEVPQTLLALRELIQNPRTATKRAIFAVWRSLENLVIKVYRYGADFLDKTVSKAIDTGSTIVGKGIVVALMTAALSGAVAMTPIASQIANSAWIESASAVVRAQIVSLAK